MNKNILWIVASSLMALSLMMAACAPAATPTAPAAPTAPITPAAPVAPATPATPTAPVKEPPQKEAVAQSSVKPKYGGSMTILLSVPTQIQNWDSAAAPIGKTEASFLVYEQIVGMDWAKGIPGTGEVDWGAGVQRFEGWGPQLAESWQIPELGTWIFQIRRGVRYALNPASEASKLVNGRELTADDIVYNVKRYVSDPRFPTAGIRNSQGVMARAVTVNKTGPWEVTIKTPVNPWIGFFWLIWGGNSHHVAAPEVIDKYGSATDPMKSVGTGPFMLSDFVAGSQASFVRNPNYWKTEPVGPGKGMQLPYLDKVNLLVVPDDSTRLAAMRTSKGDWITAVQLEDGKALTKNDPTLQFKKYLPTGGAISLKLENKSLPFKDIRVRHALMMATDREVITRDLYGGEAESFVWPTPPEYYWLFIPLKDMPQSVQALYKYNPEQAKKLLAEAGYPNGFKTTMDVRGTAGDVDRAAIIKDMWAKAGIEVSLIPREPTTFTSMGSQRAWEQMQMGVFASGGQLLTSLFSMGFRGPLLGGVPAWLDQTAEDAFQESQKYVIVNMPKADEIYRSIIPYAAEQATSIPLPIPSQYTLWQPWLKNVYGLARFEAYGMWTQEAWVDQDMKQQMTGRR